MPDDMNEIICDLENISEILFNNGYNSWGNAIRKAIAKLKEQHLDIEALKNTMQGMVEGQCIIAGNKQFNVVRCKDCRYGHHIVNSINGNVTVYRVFCTKPYVERGNATHEPDWFCADGERQKGR